jgi:predicted RNase H-like HicB family nuclease
MAYLRTQDLGYPGGEDKPAILDRMRVPVTLERDETGMVVAECPSIPGCVSQGTTEDEALENIRGAIIACLEVRAEQGMPLTIKTVELDITLG